MLDNVSKHWPIFTAIAITIVSLFNIGFFLPIGVHFIGTMDVTNVIYSFGLVFGFIAVLGPIIAQNLEKPFDWLGTLRKDRGAGVKALGVILILSGLFGMIAGSYFGVELAYFVVWAGVFTSIMLAAEYHVFITSGSVSVGRTILAFWGLMLFLVLLGAWVCSLQLNSFQTFDVTTKNGVFTNARIIRSSSS